MFSDERVWGSTLSGEGSELDYSNIRVQPAHATEFPANRSRARFGQERIATDRGGTMLARPYIRNFRRSIMGVAALVITLAPTLGLAWGGTPWVTISVMTIYRGSVKTGALVQFSPAVPNLEGCSHSAGDYAFVDFSVAEMPDGKSLYATLLVAQLAGRSVAIGTNGCTNDGYPVVYGLNVQ